MTHEGYIKLHRVIERSWVWPDPLRLKAFVYLLHRTAFADHEARGVDVKRGEVVLSYSDLEQGIGMSKGQARSFIQRGIDEGDLEKRREGGRGVGTVYGVLRWDYYQGGDTPAQQPSRNAKPRRRPTRSETTDLRTQVQALHA